MTKKGQPKKVKLSSAAEDSFCILMEMVFINRVFSLMLNFLTPCWCVLSTGTAYICVMGITCEAINVVLILEHEEILLMKCMYCTNILVWWTCVHCEDAVIDPSINHNYYRCPPVILLTTNIYETYTGIWHEILSCLNSTYDFYPMTMISNNSQYFW